MLKGASFPVLLFYGKTGGGILSHFLNVFFLRGPRVYNFSIGMSITKTIFVPYSKYLSQESWGCFCAFLVIMGRICCFFSRFVMFFYCFSLYII